MSATKVNVADVAERDESLRKQRETSGPEAPPLAATMNVSATP